MERNLEVDLYADTSESEKALSDFINQINAGSHEPAKAAESSSGNEVLFWHQGNNAYLQFTNDSEDEQNTDYIVRVIDDDGKWELHTQGRVILQPSTQYTQGFHRWRAQNWDAQWT